jgi:hypothetical protein
MDYLLTVLGALLVLFGLLGCILPILPGPPLSFAGLLLSYFSRFGNFSHSLLIWTGLAALLVTVLDYLLPIWTTKKLGGTKRGIWGATLGLVLGFFILPPLGVVVGPFFGAFIGELSGGEPKSKALRSALGSFIGFLLGTGLKLAVSGTITYYFVVELFVR